MNNQNLGGFNWRGMVGSKKIPVDNGVASNQNTFGNQTMNQATYPSEQIIPKEFEKC